MQATAKAMLRLFAAGAVALTAALVPATAQAGIGLSEFSGSVKRADDTAETQAGAHPHTATTTIRFEQDAEGNPVENLKDVVVSLPPGFVGDPTVLPKCRAMAFLPGANPLSACPPETQVGVARVFGKSEFELFNVPVAIFNMEPPNDAPAQFAFRAAFPDVYLNARVRPEDHGIDIISRYTNQSTPLTRVDVTFWGVPASPAFDGVRGTCSLLGGTCPVDTPLKPLLTNPTDCSAGPLETRIRVNSWQSPDEYVTASFDHDVDNVPMAVEGCDEVDFQPTLTAEPTSREAGAPTGLLVDLEMPYYEEPDGIAHGHLDQVTVTLPEGMVVNPSSSTGLGTCSPAEIALESDLDPTCPDASKIGTVAVDTPLLDEPMSGDVYVASQDDNPFGSLLALYVVARGPGVVLKLPGRVDPDPLTGRLTTTFDNNPQMPFTKLRLELKDGPRAPLTNPQSCGEKTTVTDLTAWSGQEVRSESTFAIDEGCAAPGFDPSFAAGTADPVAGRYSPFETQIGRSGANQGELGAIDVDLPEGLLAKLAGVTLCTDAQAAAATSRSGRDSQVGSACPAESQIGTTTVGTGSGSQPFYPRLPGSDVSGRVFLTEGYKGAPYGLAVEVPAVAGPFDLGTVTVRAAIHTDPKTARVSVRSDRLPHILEGIPLDVRDVRVDVDRDRFTLNPTSCAPTAVGGAIHSQDGTTAQRSARFQVGDCNALGFAPKLAMRLLGKGRTRTGAHPGLRAVMTQGEGQANVGRAQVTLPKSVVLDPRNSNHPKLLCGYDEGLAANCPASSVIGEATAYTPLLNRPLTGPVHLVQGIKLGPSGNRIRTTPTLLVKLSGDVDIHLRAQTTVKRDRLVTTFPEVPDAPVSRFSMRVHGGSKGILVVTRTAKAKIDICRSNQIADVETDGQNGKQRDFRARVATPCPKKRPGSPRGRGR